MRNVHVADVVALTEPLRPLWDGLDEHVRDVTRDRLEIVQEILTGFRDGHPNSPAPASPGTPSAQASAYRKHTVAGQWPNSSA